MRVIRRRFLLMTLAVALAVPTFAADEPALPRFVDITGEAGITFVHSFGDEELSNIVESSGAGCVFFDFDNDGDLDIYLVNGRYLETVSSVRGRHLAGKLKNALYRNNGDGTFTDVTDAAGVGDTGFGMAAVAADYDNDGDRDLFVTNYDRDTLYRNDGDGTFTDVTEKAGVGSELWSVGASFFDSDGDGLLDLYVGGYLVFDPEYRNYFAAEAFPGPLAYRGQKDILYRNNGDGTFADVSRKAGVGTDNGRAMGVSAARHRRRRRRGHLRRQRRDGELSLPQPRRRHLREHRAAHRHRLRPERRGHLGHGPRVRRLRRRRSDRPPGARHGLRLPLPQHGRRLLTRKRAPRPVSPRCSASTRAGRAISSTPTTTGCSTSSSSTAMRTTSSPRRTSLFRGVSGGRFADVSASSGAALEVKGVGRGSAVGDIDNDGDLDLLVLNLNGPARLLRNDGGNRGNWLMVRTVGTTSNRDGIGARIRVTAGGVTQLRDIRSSSGYLSQSDPRAHFGLGSAKTVDQLEVRWPSGRVSTIQNVKANQILTVTEPAEKAK